LLALVLFECVRECASGRSADGEKVVDGKFHPDVCKLDDLRCVFPFPADSFEEVVESAIVEDSVCVSN